MNRIMLEVRVWIQRSLAHAVKGCDTQKRLNWGELTTKYLTVIEILNQRLT